MSILKHFDASKYLMKVLQVSSDIFINNLTLINCWTRKKEEEKNVYFYLNFDFEDADDNVDTNNTAVELIASLSCNDEAQQEKQENNFLFCFCNKNLLNRLLIAIGTEQNCLTKFAYKICKCHSRVDSTNWCAHKTRPQIERSINIFLLLSFLSTTLLCQPLNVCVSTEHFFCFWNPHQTSLSQFFIGGIRDWQKSR
jgi:hypothetical protein